MKWFAVLEPRSRLKGLQCGIIYHIVSKRQVKRRHTDRTEMLKAQESQKTMWKNIHQTGRCMKIPRVRTQKERLSMLWTMLMILCTFLMMPQMTVQVMDRKEDLVTLSLNMSQTQRDLFQLPAKHQRSKGCDSAAGQLRDPVRQRSPRPVRKRVKPNRY